MKALVVSPHKNQNQSYGSASSSSSNYSHRSNGIGFSGVGSFVDFVDVNCRAFHSGVGLLPTPVKSSPIVTKKPSSFSAKTPSTYVKESPKSSTRTSTDPIPIKTTSVKNGNGNVDFNLWAGPAYSNSPPPSSLPMPKFTVMPKRTVSLDLPRLVSEIDFHPIAKSAPASPTWTHRSGLTDLFDGPDSATKTLRRILNLDATDD